MTASSYPYITSIMKYFQSWTKSGGYLVKMRGLYVEMRGLPWQGVGIELLGQLKNYNFWQLTLMLHHRWISCICMSNCICIWIFICICIWICIWICICIFSLFSFQNMNFYIWENRKITIIFVFSFIIFQWYQFAFVDNHQRTGVSLVPTSAIYLYALDKTLPNLQMWMLITHPSAARKWRG